MDYKWEVDGEIHIYEERHIKRYLVAPMTMFPVLLKLQNGELLAIVRGADYHVGERGRLDCVRSRDGGMSWSQPSVVAADGADNRNASAIQCSDGTILVPFFKADMYENGTYSAEKAKRDRTKIWITRSTDKGHTWSPPEPMAGLSPDICSPFGKTAQLADGSMLATLYGLDSAGERDDHSWLYRSWDGGRTWGDRTLIGVPFNETSVLRLPSGKLLAGLRSCRADEDAVWVSDSPDEGRTWSEPRRVAGYMEHPADLLLLQSGSILLTYGRRRSPYGIQAILSYDEGKTWDTKHRITLVCDAEDMEVGYPSSVQLDDGTICTAYYSYQDLFHISDRFRGYNSWGLHTALVRYREEDILP